MSNQLHKRFTSDQVRDFLRRYINQEFKAKYLLEVLGIKKSRFFKLLERFKKDPDGFEIKPKRENAHRQIDPLIEYVILDELSQDKTIIENEILSIVVV